MPKYKRQPNQAPPTDPVHWMLFPVELKIRSRITAAAKLRNVTTPTLMSEICVEWLKGEKK